MDSARKIVVGITGGIAAYKIPQLVRIFKKRGAQVRVVMTQNARGLVGEEALRTVSGSPVYGGDSSVYDMDHIRLAEWADSIVVCPATANTIAKIAHGIADNVLSTLCLSVPQDRIYIVPAMNTRMWLNSATQDNITLLKSRGTHVLPVGEGELACATTGPGRMIDIEEIADYVLASASSDVLRGKKLLISSGPTEEPLDPVRVITNLSSGKMGAALARMALSMGASVTVVSGPAREPLPSGARVIAVRTALQMREALVTELRDADACIMAAAVSDYRPVKVSESKMPREESGGTIMLELVANPDILAELCKIKGVRPVVGFSLETEDGTGRAKAKMIRKGCDLMILNKASTALGLDSTEFSIIDTNGAVESFTGASKQEAARTILSRVAALMGHADGT